MKKEKENEIIIHKNQSSIFDIIEDTGAESVVPDSGSNKDLFKDTIIVNVLDEDQYMVLHKQEKGMVVVEFYVKNKDNSYNMFSPKFGMAKKVISTKENGIRHFFLENVKYINIPKHLTINIALAFKQNDIIELFRLLKKF